MRIVLADPVGSRLAHLVDAQHPDDDAAYQVEGVGGSVVPVNLDLDCIDSAERVSDEESFAMAARLMREEGLFLGMSSGGITWAALELARELGPSARIATIAPDSAARYLSTALFDDPARVGT